MARTFPFVVAGWILALLIPLTGCTTQRNDGSMDPTLANRETVRAAFDRWRAGTGGPFELLAEDARWTICGSSPKSKTYRTRQEFLDEVIQPFNARLSAPLVPTMRGLYAQDDVVIAFFDGAATASDGTPYRNTYTWYLWMRDSKVVEAIAFFDTRVFDEFWERVPSTP